MDWGKIYTDLVVKARNRLAVAGYSELHHVVPRAHGGGNDAANLVRLTAREHYIAHRLLWKIHRDRATALAFRLLCDATGTKRSLDYAAAKQAYSASMLGDSNVAKRPDVRQKIRDALAVNHPFAGKKRAEHGALMRQRGHWVGANNPMHGKGYTQEGTKNHAARAVGGTHAEFGSMVWTTSREVAIVLGVSPQAVCQALRNGRRSKGWKLEYLS